MLFLVTHRFRPMAPHSEYICRRSDSSMNIRFMGWDDRLAVLRFVYDAWESISEGPPTDEPAVAALYLADPFLPRIWERAEDIVIKIVKGRSLTSDEEEFLAHLKRLYPPDSWRKVVLSRYSELQDDINSVVDALEEVVTRAHGSAVLKKTVYVFPAFALTSGTSGSAYGEDIVGIAFNVFGRCGTGTRILVHELLHVFLNRDREFRAFLRELTERFGVPAHEAHVEALTNIVWWKAGRAKRMFQRYYDPRWKALVRFEQKYRKIVRTWWRRGGSLFERVRKAFGVTKY